MPRATQKKRIYIGVDNGVSGSIGIVGTPLAQYMATPVFKQQDYTKDKKNISRIKGKELHRLIKSLSYAFDVFVVMERPLVNPGRFKATCSALRAHEATLIVLEMVGVAYQFCDSKEWQQMFLPSSRKKIKKGEKKLDPKVLKDESIDIGIRLFPHLATEIKKQKDADGLLIAEWARRSNF